jgi:hypothetical protein
VYNGDVVVAIVWEMTSYDASTDTSYEISGRLTRQ